jgi:hypothetical protein
MEAVGSSETLETFNGNGDTFQKTTIFTPKLRSSNSAGKPSFTPTQYHSVFLLSRDGL